MSMAAGTLVLLTHVDMDFIKKAPSYKSVGINWKIIMTSDVPSDLRWHLISHCLIYSLEY